MNKEMKNLLGKFFFTNVVISCLILFLCGSITAAQRTAYNTYLKNYAVVSMKSEGKKVKMEGFSKEIYFTHPEKTKLEKLKRYLKITPFASLVYFVESIGSFAKEIYSKILT